MRRVTCWTNFGTGTGWFLRRTTDVSIGTSVVDTNNGINTIFKLIIATTTTPGNYGIMFVTSDTADIFSNTARNVYSLHIY